MTDVLSSDVVGLGRDTFGPWLRAQRERRGIALTTIAEQTKIKRSLLESLDKHATYIKRLGGNFADYVDKRAKDGTLPQTMVKVRSGNDETVHYFITTEEVEAFKGANSDIFGSDTEVIEKKKDGPTRRAKVSNLHLRHISPFPGDLGEILERFQRVLVPELNLGQLRWLLRARYLVDAAGLNKVYGKPFLVSEIEEEVLRLLAE